MSTAVRILIPTLFEMTVEKGASVIRDTCVTSIKSALLSSTHQIGLLSSLFAVVLLKLVPLAQYRVDVETAIHWTEVHLKKGEFQFLGLLLGVTDC